jgi:HK97 family phage major capsid protein
MKKEDLLKHIENACGEQIAKLAKDLQDRHDAAQNDFREEILEATTAKARRDARMPPERRAVVGHQLGTLVQLLAQAKNDPAEVVKLVEASPRLKDLVPIAKSLQTGTLSAGGVLIDGETSPEFVEVLRAATVIVESGARVMPMESGKLTINRGATGASASYRGEAANAAVSEMTFGDVELNTRILDVMAPVTKQLMRRTGGAAAEYIQDDLIMAAKVKMDSTFIRSDGSANTPRGLYYLALAANILTATNAAASADGSTAPEIIADLGRMIQTLLDSNIRMVRPGWLFSNRTWRKFLTLLDSNSNFIFKEELMQGTILGIPWKRTTSIPNTVNVSGSSDDSEVYLADFFDVVIGETETMEVETSEHASYVQGGVTYHTFQRGEVLIKVCMEHDLAARRVGNEIVCLKGVRWAA